MRAGSMFVQIQSTSYPMIHFLRGDNDRLLTLFFIAACREDNGDGISLRAGRRCSQRDSDRVSMGSSWKGLLIYCTLQYIQIAYPSPFWLLYLFPQLWCRTIILKSSLNIALHPQSRQVSFDNPWGGKDGGKVLTTLVLRAGNQVIFPSLTRNLEKFCKGVNIAPYAFLRYKRRKTDLPNRCQRQEVQRSLWDISRWAECFRHWHRPIKKKRESIQKYRQVHCQLSWQTHTFLAIGKVTP